MVNGQENLIGRVCEYDHYTQNNLIYCEKYIILDTHFFSLYLYCLYLQYLYTYLVKLFNT